GYRIKLLGRAVRLPNGHTAYVAPHLIPETLPVANVEDVFNAIIVRGNATGDVMFYGRGAGELPTASACVADVMECLTSQQWNVNWSPDPAGFRDPMELETRHYFRIDGSLTDAVRAFGEVEALREDHETAFLTERISGTEAAERAKTLDVLACIRALS
ncbi:MAG: homoserine dehydrogenase, partial [Oscillibacter sp.]|nr:homoserine dehydrogenase [Oscillibacter sp.]